MINSVIFSFTAYFSLCIFGLIMPGDSKSISEPDKIRSLKTQVQYDENLVDFVKVSGRYDAVFMKRKGDHIKAKYFAASLNGESVMDRFLEWSVGKNIVMYSSGTYMDASRKPVGLTIDNGVRVNDRLENFDGLVIVYATGGVVATNLKKGNLKVRCEGIEKQFDLVNGGSFLKQQFLDCASKVQATVFQTHLLVYNNAILLSTNAKPDKRERRFLAVCQDPKTSEITHVVVNIPYSAAASLTDATVDAVNIIKARSAGDIVFMVNLDTGDGDVFNVFGSDGESKIQGTRSLDKASNLLVYYYE